MATFDGDTAQGMLLGLDEVANTLDSVVGWAKEHRAGIPGYGKLMKREAKDAAKEVRDTHAQLLALFTALKLVDVEDGGIAMGEASFKLPKRRRG